MSLAAFSSTAAAANKSPSIVPKTSTVRLSPFQVESPTNSPKHQRKQQGKSIDAIDTLQQQQWKHLYVLPVLLLEFLALALTRAVLPSLLLQQYGTSVYLVMGCTECIRGLLAFVSCPLFGKISDVVGRKLCLFVTVAGTCAPVCSLALLQWDHLDAATTALDASNHTMATVSVQEQTAMNVTTPSSEDVLWSGLMGSSILQPHALNVFVVLLALSGVFSSTFTLVFAYISDTVHERDERVSAYGLALATFGLSFTLGPMAGGYLAQYNTRTVFVCSLLFTILDLMYIYLILPESKPNVVPLTPTRTAAATADTPPTRIQWNPWDTMRIVALDPFLRLVGQVAFLYYTALWAVISTLVLYAAKRFGLGPSRLGELMSALGLSTMVAEAVLVRILVPMLGEKKSMRLGLAAFGLQCVVLGFAYEGWHLFVCIAFSLLGNLVYPSLTSLVSASVEPKVLGEALGAVNGIKALTEGIGPLVFGSLMTLSEESSLPGWPYLLAAILVYLAYRHAARLPDTRDDDNDYIHELEYKRQRRKRRQEATRMADVFATKQERKPHYNHYDDDEDDDEEEYVGLLDDSIHMLSEIETDEDEAIPRALYR